MNKTRITYRITPVGSEYRVDKLSGPSQDQERKEQGKIIPLHHEEFHLVDEQPPVPMERGDIGEEWFDTRKERKERTAKMTDYQPLNTFTTDFGAWNSPFDAETERLEQLIREAGRESERPADRQSRRQPDPQPERQFDRDSERPANRQSRRQPDVQSDWQFDQESDAFVDRQSDRQPTRPESRHSDPPPIRQSNRQTERKPDYGSDKETDREASRTAELEDIRNSLKTDKQRQRSASLPVNRPVSAPGGRRGVEIDKSWRYDDSYYNQEYHEIEIEEDPYGKDKYVRRGGGMSWLVIVVAVTGAIVTGILFGIFALSLFSGKDGQGMAANGTANVQESAGNTGTGKGNNALNGGDSAGKTAQSDKAVGGTAAAPDAQEHVFSLQLPSRTYYMLQNGVFSNEDGANTAKSDLSKKGLAAAAVAGDQYFVYTGVTTDRGDALLLSHQLQSKAVETFIKAYDIPAADQIAWGNAGQEQLQTYFNNGSKLIGTMIELSLLHLGENDPTAIDTAALSSVKTEHQSWVEAATSIGKTAGETVQPMLNRMNNAMNTALLSLDKYNKNPSVSYLWQAQSATMEYLLAEKELLLAVAVN